MNIADSVQETISGTSTAVINTLAGATSGNRTFAAAVAAGAFAVGATNIPLRVEDDAGNWLTGAFTLTNSTTLTRTAIGASSAAGADVTLAGTVRRVSVVPTSLLVRTLAAVDDIAFATAVPLTTRGTMYMPQQSVSSVLPFTIAAGAVKGALVYLRLIADGTNAPTFTGMKEWGGSSGYDNRNGIANQVQFFYDGVDYWYSISQAVGAVAVDAVAPTASNAAVANATPSIVNITMSESLDPGFVPAASAFTVGGHTVSSVAISGSSINLTCSAAFVNGEAARTVAYAQPGTNHARDIAGNLLANFSGLAITNNVGAVASAVTMAGPTAGAVSVASANFTVGVAPVGAAISGTVIVTPSDGGGSGTFTPTSVSLTTAAPTATFTYTPSATAGARTISATNNGGLTNPTNITYTSTSASFARMGTLVRVAESGTGPYSYLGSGGSYGGGSDADSVLSTTLQTGVDGSFSIKVTSTPATNNGEVLLAVDGSAAAATYATMDYAFLGHSSGYQPFTSGGAGTATATTGAANDIMRMRRTGTSLFAEVSKDNGSTWTTINTWTGVSTGVLYFHVMPAGVGSFNSLTAVGLG